MTRSTAAQVLAFLGVFFALQFLYVTLHDPVGMFWIHHVAVVPSAHLIEALGLPIARPEGDLLIGETQRLRVRAGCEGTETLFLLVAALVVFPRAVRWKAIGILLGAVLVVTLNTARIGSLWAALAFAPAHFDALHTVFAPLLMIGITYLYVITWARISSQEAAQ